MARDGTTVDTFHHGVAIRKRRHPEGPRLLLRTAGSPRHQALSQHGDPSLRLKSGSGPNDADPRICDPNHTRL